MSVDYDAPRGMPEAETAEPLDELKSGKARPGTPVIDPDEAGPSPCCARIIVG